MSLFDAQGELHVKAQAREVFDVTGAGDTVIATLAVLVGAHPFGGFNMSGTDSKALRAMRRMRAASSVDTLGEFAGSLFTITTGAAAEGSAEAAAPSL
mgnify:CR=1 FL=1